MADNTRKTSNAIHKIPEYYTGTIEPTGDQLKMGDMWFEENIIRAKPSGNSLPSGTSFPSISKIIEKRKREESSRPPIKIPKLNKKRRR